MMNTDLVDTHAHMCAPELKNDLEGVLHRAREQGIGAIISVAEDLEEARGNLELARRHPLILPAAGLYPGNADIERAARMQEFIRSQREHLAAIGEVGLDFRLAESEETRELQREVLVGFVRLALELDLPLNVHSRSAGRHAADLLIEHGARRVQMHAFDGKAGSAQKAVEAGYFFSLPPSASRSRQKQKLIRQLPLSCLLLETDSPVLGPSPEETNEPANLAVALRTIAEIKEISMEQALEAVRENTRRLYGDLAGPRG
ncbi:MAG: TatD family hydrolase [Desulfohalobiaceae bacterium]|nr:TatD family hydrolase [Desulfohalobiaceae bacterium]